MAIASLRQVSIRFRGPLLLDDVSCQIEEGDRIGLVGRNGAGKTTLMRILSGQVVPDHGSVDVHPSTGIAWLPQDVPRDLAGTLHDIVTAGLPDGWRDSEAPWEHEQRVDQVLQEMDLDPTARIESQSSGRKRRVLLARALAAGPQLLMLDEPTNHLDLPSIEWLENYLRRWRGTLLFVTHDRVFLQTIATRIWEIDRGRIFDWSCDYTTFLQRKAVALEAEEKQQALFDKRLAEEEAWIRQGVKARRTRNEGRVRALKEMRQQRSARQKAPQMVRMQIQDGQRSGNLIADVQQICFAYGDQAVVSHFSTLIMRGDRVGIVGANGAGKTTLLRLILGQLTPQSGSVRLGTNLQIAYFDQLREQLRDDATVQDNVGDGYDSVTVGGRSQHVLGYLQNFLFTPERARTEVRYLSGGERNRVLLAKLFAKPANVIVLDEPTNDLDAETLELLEEQLSEFDGTILVVSHDRAFLNEVVSCVIVFEEDGVREYVGGYDDWQRQVTRAKESEAESSRPAAKETASPARSLKKLSFKETQELQSLPSRVEELEAFIVACHSAMASPTFYQQARSVVQAKQNELQQAETDLRCAYKRWEELESRKGE